MRYPIWLAALLLLTVPVLALQGTPGRSTSASGIDQADDIADACGGFNPYFAVTSFGASDGRVEPVAPAIVAFTDTVNDDPDAAITLATRDQVGAVLGLAYDHTRGHLYAAAYHKRGSAFGPGGPGQIYRIDVASRAVEPFVVLPTGADLHDFGRDEDEAAAEFVGAVSLGDIEVSGDGSTLFAMNVLNGRIYHISLPDGAIQGSFRHGAASAEWRRNARPFGLGFRDGWLYHGVVDSRADLAEPGELSGTVYRSRPDGSDLSEVASFTFDYARTPAWQRWNTSLPLLRLPEGRLPFGQPMIGDIAFADSGEMLIGVRDRVTDMMPPYRTINARHGAGDVLPARDDGSGWQVITVPERFADRFTHDESLWGTLASFPGLDVVVAPAAAPVNASDVGAVWLDNVTGGATRFERLRPFADTVYPDGSTGLGDVESLCPPGAGPGEGVPATATAVAATRTAEARGTATAVAATQTAAPRVTAGVPHEAIAQACHTDNPFLATACFSATDFLPGTIDAPAVVAFRDTPGNEQPLMLASVRTVGAVWGLAHSPREQAVFAAAVHKRLARFGSGGPGAIYRIDIVSGGIDVFAQVPDAGPDTHDTRIPSQGDNSARDWAGKLSLGDLDLSGDERSLFVTNLHDRHIYRYAVPSGQLLGRFAHGAAGEPWADDARPFGLKFHEGRLYHGVVNAAERSGAHGDLAAYVYASLPDGSDMRQVLAVPLDYPRGVARLPGVVQFPGEQQVPIEWQPWHRGYNDITRGKVRIAVYPQPMVGDIEFDASGNMILGLKDRHGDMALAQQVQVGNSIRKPGLELGDVLLAERDGEAWRVTPLPEHFGDYTTLADESALGALARLERADTVVGTSMWPQSFSQSSVLGPTIVGATWLDAPSGNALRQETVCQPWYFAPAPAVPTAPPGPWAGDRPDAPQHSEWFPGNGMGDLERLCGPPPTATPTPTTTPTPVGTPTPTRTPSPSPSPTAPRTPSPTPTATATPVPLPIYLPIAINDRCDPKVRRIDVVLVIDASLTMRDPTRAGRPKIDAAREAARRFVDGMTFPGDRAAVVSFNAEATVEVGLTGDLDALHAALDAIHNHEYTRIDLGIAAAHDLLRPALGAAGRAPAIILLTDGRSNPVPVERAIDAAAAAKDDGIALFTVGLGDEIEFDALRRMAGRPDDFRHAPDGEDLGPIYARLAVEIPCPPSAYWPYRTP